MLHHECEGQVVVAQAGKSPYQVSPRAWVEVARGKMGPHQRLALRQLDRYLTTFDITLLYHALGPFS